MIILVIGFGRDSKQLYGHKLVFKENAKIRADGQDRIKFRNVSSFDFILHHIGNPETKNALNKWKEEKQIRKVIGFTSGSEREENKQLCKEYNIPLLTGLVHKNDVLNLRWEDLKQAIDLNNIALAELLQPKSGRFENLILLLMQKKKTANGDRPIFFQRSSRWAGSI
jgi:hypothetical protein